MRHHHLVRGGVALVAIVLVAVALAVTPSSSTPSGTVASAATAGPAREAWVRSTVSRMTLRELVGQLFMTQAYGETADTTAPADVAENQQAYGVDNAAQLIDKYRLGGIIYFAWSNNVNEPQQIAGLSNGVQDAALGQRREVPLAGRHRPGGRHRRPDRAPATELPGNMALGAGRSATDADGPPRSSAPS